LEPTTHFHRIAAEERKRMKKSGLDIVHYSDVLCVWAYIAQIRVNELQMNFPDDVRVEYRFFQVFGDVAGKMVAQWGDRDGLKGYARHVQEVAAQFEHIEISPRVWIANTPTSSLPAHLVLCAIRSLRTTDPDSIEPDLGERVLEALRRAFFVELVDISNRSELLEVSRQAGVDITKLTKALDSGAAHAQLAADLAEATQNAVRASPTMIFNEGRQILTGNVGYRVLEANIRELLRSRGDQQSWC
jgi:predicted DsbA family dithiol-disulfide isomerase